MRFTPFNSKPALYSLTALAAALLLFLIILPNSDNASAQQAATATPTPRAITFRAISAGVMNGCGIRMDGTLMCWGLEGHVRVRGSTTPVDVWGASDPASGDTYTSISMGYRAGAALTSDGKLATWGYLTDFLDNYVDIPRSTDRHKAVGTGDYHMCVLTRDLGEVKCWGHDMDYGTVYDAPSGSFTSISAGYYHTCALRSDGAAVCWGQDTSGKATPPSGTFTSISVGYFHSCGLRASGAAVCWGSNLYGQSTPPSNETFTSIDAGSYHTCGLRADGVAVCWGSSTYGQTSPPAGVTFTSISAGGGFSCGISANGPVVCWGSNTDGKATPPTSVPITATPTLTPTSVSATATPTPTHTPTPTGTNTPSPTNTPTVTGTPPTATPTATGTPPTATPTLTPTTTTRTDVPTPTRTATTVTTSGNANARISQLEAQSRTQQEQITTLRNQVTTQQEQIETQKGKIETQSGFIDSLRDLIRALTARFDEFVGVGGPAATATPTHTPTPTNTPVTALEHTPTPTTVPTATPTRVSRSTLNPACIGKIGLGWLTGTWNADCQSTKTPPTAKEGTRYARYYAFTLDAPSRITVTVSSTEVRDTYLYLLRGSGNEGEIVNRSDSEIVEQLDTGTYTIEATTYQTETSGNFTLTLDIAATGVSAAAGAPR